MRHLLLTAAAVALLAISAGQANSGESWVFRRSYYSHYPVKRVQIGRQSAGPRVAGSYVRGGYRVTHSHIHVRGQGHEHGHVVEAWTQGPR